MRKSTETRTTVHVHMYSTGSVVQYMCTVLVHAYSTGTLVLVLYFGTRSGTDYRYISSEKSIQYAVRLRHLPSNNSLRHDFGTGNIMFIYKHPVLIIGTSRYIVHVGILSSMQVPG